MKNLINSNLFQGHYIATAKELKEMSKSNDYQSIKLKSLQIDFAFNADFEPPYQIDIISIKNGKHLFRKSESVWFDCYKNAKKFIQNKIAKIGN